MKQHITPKQAKEMTEDQFYSLFDEIVPRKDWANYHHKKMTIGKMIEVLGEITIVNTGYESQVYFKHNDDEIVLPDKELADILWEAIVWRFTH